MGRASNRKWRTRRTSVWKLLKSSFRSDQAEAVRLLSIFGLHRQFQKYFTVRRTKVAA